MKIIQLHKYKMLLMTFLAFSLMAFAQKETKNFKETFNVNKDVLVDINTAHADIEFETWNKNVVEVEAILEVEGLSKQQAEEYFKSWNFEVVGNSKKVTITTKPIHWSPHKSDVTFV